MEFLEPESCAVCLSDLEAVVRLRCNHRFCSRCLSRCAEHDLMACPLCRMPHELDPKVLKEQFEAFRATYRDWRLGAARGSSGEFESVTQSKKAVDGPAKDAAKFRDYAQLSDRAAVVATHYRDMRTHQTVDFVKAMKAKYSFADGACRARMTVREAFTKLEGYVDSSDPDLALPNLVHMLQTAEGIRAAGHADWFQLVGLVHDMGKIMFLWGDDSIGQRGEADASQWALGGDTWAVGCALPAGPARPGVVFPEFNALNPDMHDARYNTPHGVYAPHCGLEHVSFAYGHDEYLFDMLSANAVGIPAEGLAMVRYHSAYPWHTARCYDHLMTAKDHEMLEPVLQFNQFDLYTKDEGNPIDVAELWPYYQKLIDKYMPGELRW